MHSSSRRAGRARNYAKPDNDDEEWDCSEEEDTPPPQTHRRKQKLGQRQQANPQAPASRVRCHDAGTMWWPVTAIWLHWCALTRWCLPASDAQFSASRQGQGTVRLSAF